MSRPRLQFSPQANPDRSLPRHDTIALLLPDSDAAAGRPRFHDRPECGVFLSLLIPRPAPLKVICIAAVIQMIVCLVYYLTYQTMVSPAADSVVYEKGALCVRRHGRAVSIPVASIRGRLGLNPETITLDLSEPTAIGSSVTFIPPARFPSTKEHPMMATLRELLARPS